MIGKRVDHVIDLENEYSEFVESNFKAFSILCHTYQEFHMDTIESAAAVWEEIGNVFIRFIEKKFPFDHQVCFDAHVRA